MTASGDRGERHPSRSRFQRRNITEDTPLLAAATDVPYAHHGTSSPDETIYDDELEGTDIDPNEFDLMLTKSISYSSGLGIEPESQETSMLRGPRKYHGSLSRSSSWASGRRRSVVSSNGVEEEPIAEEDEEDEDEMKKSPFLGGVSVSQFWLIYSGILANLVSIFHYLRINSLLM
jgi:hypothetical protein